LEGADALDLALRLRGVPIWRDRRRMGWGDYKSETVQAAIGEQCSGFVLHYAEPVLDSDFVCDIELPAMDARRRRDPEFFSGAVFRFSPLAQAGQRLRDRANVELGEPLGSRVVDGDPTEGLRAAANDVLARYLYAQLDDNVVRVQVETRDALPVESEAVLQLAWAPPLAHDADEYDHGVWTQQLQPALADLRQALTDTRAPRTLRVGGNMHLSAALALGYEFREPTGWSLQLDRDGLSCFSDRVAPDLGGWRVVRSPGGGDVDHRLVICVHASKNLDAAVTRHCGELAPAKIRVDISPPDGVAGRTTVTPDSVNALAAAIAAEVLHIRDAYGTTETHLYLACPWPLAALLGWHLGSCGRVVCHEAAVGRDTYRTSCVLL
jgi:hypothetical protein